MMAMCRFRSSRDARSRLMCRGCSRGLSRYHGYVSSASGRQIGAGPPPASKAAVLPVGVAHDPRLHGTVQGRGQFGGGCANQRVNITQSSSVLRIQRLSTAQHCYERSSRPLARRWAVDFPEACGARESSANISTEPPAERPFAAPAPPQRTWRARRGSNHARSSR